MGTTPLMVVATKEAAELLVSYGAKITLRNQHVILYHQINSHYYYYYYCRDTMH
jgi:hypothetical protein